MNVLCFDVKMTDTGVTPLVCVVLSDKAIGTVDTK